MQKIEKTTDVVKRLGQIEDTMKQLIVELEEAAPVIVDGIHVSRGSVTSSPPYRLYDVSLKTSFQRER